MAFDERRGNRGGGFRGGGGGRGPREMHDATCAECGADTQVPFRPTGERPVYCRDCFQSKGGGDRGPRGGGGGRGDREMHDTKCSECGSATQVPFKPSGDRPVYCRDCFASKRTARY